MRGELAIGLIALSLVGCKWLPKRKSVQDAGVDAAVDIPAVVDAAPPSQTVDAKDLPQGYFESADDAKVSLGCLPRTACSASGRRVTELSQRRARVRAHHAGRRGATM